MRKRIILPSALVAGLFMLTGLALLGNVNAQNDCNVDRWNGSDLITDFMDSLDVALAAARASVPPVVLEMQTRYRTFERADHPACLAGAVDYINEGMENYISAMLSFLKDQNNLAGIALTAAEARMTLAAALLEEAGVEVDPRLGVS